jgi:hypothetical protein
VTQPEPKPDKLIEPTLPKPYWPESADNVPRIKAYARDTDRQTDTQTDRQIQEYSQDTRIYNFMIVSDYSIPSLDHILDPQREVEQTSLKEAVRKQVGRSSVIPFLPNLIGQLFRFQQRQRH